jgi:hypothetical protein
VQVVLGEACDAPCLPELLVQDGEQVLLEVKDPVQAGLQVDKDYLGFRVARNAVYCRTVCHTRYQPGYAAVSGCNCTAAAAVESMLASAVS